MSRKAFVGSGSVFDDSFDNPGSWIRKFSVLSIDSNNNHVTGIYELKDENTGTVDKSFLFGTIRYRKNGKIIILNLTDKDFDKNVVFRIKSHKNKPEKDQCFAFSSILSDSKKYSVVAPSDPDVEGFSRTGNPTTASIASGTFGVGVQPGTVVIKNAAGDILGYDVPSNNTTGTFFDINSNSQNGTITYSSGTFSTTIANALNAEALTT